MSEKPNAARTGQVEGDSHHRASEKRSAKVVGSDYGLADAVDCADDYIGGELRWA